MGIGTKAVKKLLDAGIDAQEEHRQNAERLALLYIEFGYKACERGENLEQAIMSYHALANAGAKP